MPAKRTDIDPRYVVRKYTGGVGVQGIAEALGCSPSPVERILRERGVKLRNRSEQQFARMKRASKAEIKNLTAAAHAASRGSVHSQEYREKIAKTREERCLHTSPLEDMIFSDMQARGLSLKRQTAIGRYNADFTIDSIAVEIFSGGWHFVPSRRSFEERRINDFLDGGWGVIVLCLDSRRRPYSPAVADYLYSSIEGARSDPSAAGKYRVIWGAGEYESTGSLENNEVSLVPPFHTRRNSATGRYEAVPR